MAIDKKSIGFFSSPPPLALQFIPRFCAGQGSVSQAYMDRGKEVGGGGEQAGVVDVKAISDSFAQWSIFIPPPPTPGSCDDRLGTYCVHCGPRSCCGALAWHSVQKDPFVLHASPNNNVTRLLGFADQSTPPCSPSPSQARVFGYRMKTKTRPTIFDMSLFRRDMRNFATQHYCRTRR